MLAEDPAPSRLERAKYQTRRLIQDLRGDRIGLIAFAGQSFILSPLTVDANALNLLVDALDPDLTSAGGTELSSVLAQGRQLLFAGDPVADRVLVVFTDGEAHDSLPEILSASERLRRDGVRLIVVTEGGVEPARIPVRDVDGTLVGHQRDPSGNEVRTVRRDDIASAIADEAHGVVVASEIGDQAGAVRNLVAGYVRSPQATSTAAQDISRAWIPIVVALLLLLLHTFTRRTAALAAIVLSLWVGDAAEAQGPRNRADEAWRAGEFRLASEHYLEQIRAGEGGDTAWFNLGTAALAARDTSIARRALERAARSLDPEIRSAAVYNLGLLAIQMALRDSTGAVGHLENARRWYREALLLHPNDPHAKWNLELVLRLLPPPPTGGAPQQGPPDPNPREYEPPSGITRSQAEQILNSMSEEERRALLERNLRRRQGQETRGRKEW
jgi:Ca-activated chloride channel family protein